MKFQTVLAFDKHLREAAPDHLSLSYLIAGASRYERKKILQKILTIYGPLTGSTPLFYEAGSVRIGELLELALTRPFWGSAHLIVVENMEEFSKEDLDSLANYLAKPSPFARILLSGSSFKAVCSLYNKGKKEIVVLDLSEEKPWDRDKRLKEWCTTRALSDGKILVTEALSALFEYIGPDYSALEQELIKLVSYVGERKRIELIDVETLCMPRVLRTGWQVAEALVWQGRKEPIPLDLSTLLGLIGQIRYHLNIGERLAHAVSKHTLYEELPGQFTELKPTVLQRYFDYVKYRDPSYFREGLLHLFDLEITAKTSSFGPGLLFDLFVAKWISQYATHSIS